MQLQAELHKRQTIQQTQFYSNKILKVGKQIREQPFDAVLAQKILHHHSIAGGGVDYTGSFHVDHGVGRIIVYISE